MEFNHNINFIRKWVLIFRRWGWLPRVWGWALPRDLHQLYRLKGPWCLCKITEYLFGRSIHVKCLFLTMNDRSLHAFFHLNLLMWFFWMILILVWKKEGVINRMSLGIFMTLGFSNILFSKVYPLYIRIN